MRIDLGVQVHYPPGWRAVPSEERCRGRQQHRASASALNVSDQLLHLPGIITYGDCRWNAAHAADYLAHVAVELIADEQHRRVVRNSRTQAVHRRDLALRGHLAGKAD